MQNSYKERFITAIVGLCLLVYTMAMFHVLKGKIDTVTTENTILRSDVEDLGEQVASLKRVAADQAIISTELLGEITPEEAVKMLKRND